MMATMVHLVQTSSSGTEQKGKNRREQILTFKNKANR